jgi:hypothetical protein
VLLLQECSRSSSCPTNEHLLFASRNSGHKKMVSVVKHRMSLIIFLQSYVIPFCEICAVMCRKCVIVCTVRAGESHFGNLFMV